MEVIIKQEKVENIYKTGLDIIEKMEQIMVNEISKTISKQIVNSIMNKRPILLNKFKTIIEKITILNNG